MMNSDSNAMVDRRIVVKLLVTYFEKKQSPEVLGLMARMLGLSGLGHTSIQPMCSIHPRSYISSKCTLKQSI